MSPLVYDFASGHDRLGRTVKWSDVLRRRVCRPRALRGAATLAVLAAALAALALTASAPATRPKTPAPARRAAATEQRTGPDRQAISAPVYVGSPVAMSGAVTLANCATEGQEGEVSLAADPGDSRRLVAVWMQRVIDVDGVTPTNTNVVGSSDDGGRTWSRTGVQGMSRCTGTNQQAEAAGDPFVAIGIDGITYLSSAGAYGLCDLCPSSNDVQGNWSTDGGGSWSPVVIVDDHRTNGPGNDFPPVVADPTLAGSAYIVHPRVPQGIQMSRTTDGGKTWTPNNFPVTPPGTGVRTGPQLVVLGNNTMVLEFVDATGPTGMSPETVFTTRSTTGGLTWSVPAPLGVLPGFTGSPRAAAAPDGTVYVSWWNGGKVEIVRSEGVSVDGNLMWSAPITVSDAAGTLSAFRGPGPAVAVDPSGTVGLLWYDSRTATAAAPGLTDVWFAFSQDRGATWTERHVAGPFDSATLSDTLGGSQFTLGDYISLVPLTDGFGAAFGQALGQTSNPTDIFYSHISHRAADLSLTKTDSPDPALAGGNLSYQLTVGNGGPDPATGVTVTDALPAATSFVSASASQGTCSGTSTVTCSLGSIASGAGATVDIVVQTTQAGTLTNTASVGGDVFDANSANDSATAGTTVEAPTAVRLVSFTATASGRTVSVRWRTAAETQLLGFNVYRLGHRNRTRLNPNLVPATEAERGGSYSWRDRRPGRSPRYILEVVRRDGSRTTYGPVAVEGRSRTKRREVPDSSKPAPS